MIGGFGLLATPAEYGNSGVMTFIVNHGGVVFQKDFGLDMSRIVADMAGSIQIARGPGFLDNDGIDVRLAKQLPSRKLSAARSSRT